eukprot:NODE_613_length_5985_cov_0.176351.p2 type:complete len:358 gc:universal NODE_613_length_5985_cov_0.176351:4568-3495(-)
MLLITSICSGFFSCLDPEPPITVKLKCKISEVPSKPDEAVRYFQLFTVDFEGSDDMKIIGRQNKEILLNFRVSTDDTKDYLTIAAGKRTCFSKPLAEKRLVIDDIQSADGQIEIIKWRKGLDMEYELECGKANSKMKYDAPNNQKITCYNRKNEERRTSKIFDLSNTTPEVLFVGEDYKVLLSIFVTQYNGNYGYKIQTLNHDSVEDEMIVFGNYFWNEFRMRRQLVTSFTDNNGDTYSSTCADYQSGDELPDIDLNIKCVVDLQDIDSESDIAISSGDSIYFFQDLLPDNQNCLVLSVQKSNGKYFLKIKNAWNQYRSSSLFELRVSGDSLKLKREASYRFNMPKFDRKTIKCKNK